MSADDEVDEVVEGVVALGASAGGVEALSKVAARLSRGPRYAYLMVTPEALLDARDSEMEMALWVAIRSLQEKAKLARQLASAAGTAALSRR